MPEIREVTIRELREIIRHLQPDEILEIRWKEGEDERQTESGQHTSGRGAAVVR